MGAKKNKKIIFNDPIYGFIEIPNNIIYQLIEHPFVQRLRRIKQLGLTNLVYPGAYHTRFHHVMGAMHLMDEAIKVLRGKGKKITDEEATGAQIAILLHDIGHGPFSHALENNIVYGVSHEDLSVIFMEALNREFNQALSLAIKIFKGTYRKKFLHQLVSSQLDVDRLDYLKRDSFFTGVSEGVISSGRIIKMLNVSNDNLVVDAKGIYSVEQFLMARRFMYWQVYLHKTVIAAEFLLLKILKRAKELSEKGEVLFATPALSYFLQNKIGHKEFISGDGSLQLFAELDDYDIFTSVKVWVRHQDKVLSKLCNKMVNRNLFKIEIQTKPFTKKRLRIEIENTAVKLKISKKEANYFVFTDVIKNSTYSQKKDKINILYKDGQLIDVAKASDQLNMSVLSKTVKKYFLCYPKD